MPAVKPFVPPELLASLSAEAERMNSNPYAQLVRAAARQRRTQRGPSAALWTASLARQRRALGSARARRAVCCWQGPGAAPQRGQAAAAVAARAGGLLHTGRPRARVAAHSPGRAEVKLVRLCCVRLGSLWSCCWAPRASAAQRPAARAPGNVLHGRRRTPRARAHAPCGG